MRYLIVLIISCLLLCSCKNKPSILGTWISVEDASGFEFYEDGTADNLLGFYTIENNNQKDSIYSYFTDLSSLGYTQLKNYEGDITKYDLKDDTLSIYNLHNKKWDKFKVELKADTLILIATVLNNCIPIQVRHTYKRFTDTTDTSYKDEESFFEDIVFYKGRLYESDFSDSDAHYVSIDKNGKMIKQNEFASDSVMVYQLSANQLKRVNKMLSRLYSSMNCIKDSSKKREYGFYAPSEVSILKDEKIHTIQVDNQNDCESYKLFKQFYFFASSISQYIQPDSIIMNKKIFIRDVSESYFFYFRYNGDQTQCAYLTYSEGFYLWNALQKAKQVDSSILFDEKYVLDSSYKNREFPDQKLIYTDGRYYRYKDQIVDLGYNFIERNDLNKSFVDNQHIIGGYTFSLPSGLL